jgi:hypothetical protein
MSSTGKRRGGIFQRLGNWIAGTPPPSEEDGQTSTGGNQYSQWSDAYNDTKLDGARVIDGKFCRTVGEVKAATAKKYGHDI